MNRKQALPYVCHIIDDSLNGRNITDQQPPTMVNLAGDGFKYRPVLVGWQCGFEPMFVAVYSYLDIRLDDDDCVELATDYLTEMDWFSGEPTEPDYIIR